VKAISGKDFAKILEKKGWVLKRIKGSHHIYMKEGSPVRISVHSLLRIQRGVADAGGGSAVSRTRSMILIRGRSYFAIFPANEIC